MMMIETDVETPKRAMLMFAEDRDIEGVVR